MIEKGIGQTPKQAAPISKARVDNNGLSLRMAHLNFLGRGLVNLAHDLKNHLATMNESAGLMVDFLKLKKEQRFGWAGRLFKRPQAPSFDRALLLGALNTIQKEVVQGASLIQRLGRFAHRLEETPSDLRGNEALEEILDALMEKAKEKGIRLETRVSGMTPMIETDPIGFQMAIWFVAESLMSDLEEGHRVVLKADVREGFFQVCLSSPCPQYPPRFATEGPADEGFYREIIEELGVRVLEASDHGKCFITLGFPLADGKR
jgi:hypothetical protein